MPKVKSCCVQGGENVYLESPPTAIEVLTIHDEPEENVYLESPPPAIEVFTIHDEPESGQIEVINNDDDQVGGGQEVGGYSMTILEDLKRRLEESKRQKQQAEEDIQTLKETAKTVLKEMFPEIMLNL